MSRAPSIRRLLRPSRSALRAALVVLAGCAPREAPPEETAEQLELQPTPVTHTPSGLPTRALPPAPDVATPALSLTASDGTALRLVSLRAEVSVQEPLAHTELHLVFDNPEDRTLEGRFSFDLPPRAAVSRFAVKVGDRWLEGEVVERLAHVAPAGSLPLEEGLALVEKEPGRRFSAQVSPIAARGTKQLVLSYSQALLDAEGPYRLPLRGLPRLDALDARVLVDRPTGEVTPGGTTTEREVIEIHEQDHLPERDLEIAAFRPRQAVGLRSDDLALARVTVGGSLAPEPLGGLTILFDTSASRALGFEAKVRQLGEVVRALRARAGGFTLRVAAFDQGMSLVFEGNADAFGDEHLQALYTRRALGASDLAGALRRTVAIGDRGGRVLLMTDGVATAGDEELAELASAARSLARAGVERIDAIVDGGLRDRAALRAVTTALARRGTVADAERTADRIADALMLTALPDTRISVEGSQWSWPQIVEGLQPGDEVLVYANVPRSASMTVVLTGAETTRTEIPLAAVDRPLLERAWAGARIEYLQRVRSRLAPHEHEERERLHAQIVELSTKHRVPSDATALLLLETEWDYQRFGVMRRGRPDVLVMGAEGLEPRARALPERGELLGSPPGSEPIPRMTGSFDPAQAELPAGSPARVEDGDVWASLTADEVDDPHGVDGTGTGRGGGGDDPGLVGKAAAGRRAGRGGRGKRGPMVRMAEAKVQGGLERDVVHRIVRGELDAIRSCYDQGLARDPGLHGRVEVQLAINSVGKVVSGVVSKRTLPDAAVAACIGKAVQRIEFPKPTSAGLVLLTCPFVLSRAVAPTPAPLAPEHAARIAEQERAAEARHARQREQQARRAAEARRTEGSPHEGRMFDVMQALETDDAEAAVQLALRWSDESPADVMALLALGESLERRGTLEAAARAHGSILDLYPTRADLRRHASARLEQLDDDAALALAIDGYRHAAQQGPSHPSGHRMLAFALARAGQHEPAFDALVASLARISSEERSAAARWILTEDAGLVAAAWLRHEPGRADEIRARARTAGIAIATSASTRFVMTWEPDSTDVGVHVYDGHGGHAHPGEPGLPSGGTLHADGPDGHGLACFAIEGVPRAFPYRFEADASSRGPMGLGMGTLQIVEHDGSGGLHIETRPFVLMKEHAVVALGDLSGTLARKGE